MNTVLQAQNVEDQIDSILEVYEVFDANGLNAKDYQTLKKGTGFYWFKTVNKIVILDEETKNIIYPTDLENYTYEPGTLFSLSLSSALLKVIICVEVHAVKNVTTKAASIIIFFFMIILLL